VNFGVKESNENVIGVRDNEGSTIISINKTIKFLKRCNKEWLDHLNEKREKFAELNYYKTRQISKLREKLALFMRQDKNSSLDKELRDLLMSLNQNVDKKMLAEANQKAFETLEDEFLQDKNNGADDSNGEISKQATIFKDLTNKGFSRFFFHLK